MEVGPGLTRNLKKKWSQIYILEQYTVCICLLKVVSYYDLSVLSMSVSKKANLDGWNAEGGWVG